MPTNRKCRKKASLASIHQITITIYKVLIINGDYIEIFTDGFKLDQKEQDLKYMYNESFITSQRMSFIIKKRKSYKKYQLEGQNRKTSS